MILALALALAAWALPVQAQDDDGITLREIEREFLDRIEKSAAEKNWRAVFDLYALALSRHRDKLVRPDPARPVWRSVTDHLNRRLASLPPEALEVYRRDHDGRARAAYQAARAADNRTDLARIADDFFLSSVTDELLDYLALRAFEENRPQEAAHHWRRLLLEYPDSDVPLSLVAARLAVAAQTWPNPALLDVVKKHAAERGIDGRLEIAGHPMLLSAFLKELTIRASEPETPVSGAPAARALNEIRMFHYDFGAAPERRAPDGRRPTAPFDFSAAPQHPFVAAHGRAGSRDVVIATNGFKVIALDPSRARQERPGSGIYWRYDPDAASPAGRPSFERHFIFTQPFIGGTADGGEVFVTLYSREKNPEIGAAVRDFFRGPARLAAFDLLTGRVLWDSDDPALHARYRTLPFYERNFAWSAPPLVRGDRLYVGVCTSPWADSESHVLCIDRRTGLPLWSVELGFAGNVVAAGGERGAYTTHLTLLTEDAGMLYAHGNQGVVAAIHPFSGHVAWLAKLPRATAARENWAPVRIARELRPPNPPLVHRGRLYLLPQDQPDLLVFDVAGGERLAAPQPLKSELGDQFGPALEFQWSNIRYLLGVSGDWLILGGGESYVMRLAPEVGADGREILPLGWISPLVGGNLPVSGRGALADGILYLPASPAEAARQGSLTTYSDRSWGLDRIIPWQEPGEYYGNLLVAGSYLVVSAAYVPPRTPSSVEARLLVYASEAILDAEFAERLRQSPPDPEAFLAHADIMHRNRRLERAADSYLGFIRAAENVPRWQDRIRQVRTALYGIFLERAEEAAGSPDPAEQAKAADHFRRAQEFAFDGSAFTKATLRLAETYEQLARARQIHVLTLRDGGTVEGVVTEQDPVLYTVLLKDGTFRDVPKADVVKREARPSADVIDFARRAVGEYRRLLEKAKRGTVMPGPGEEAYKPLWDHASDRIRELTKKFGDEVYAPVEKAAQEALARAKQEGVGALRRIPEEYPESRAALEAYRQALEEYAKQEKWRDVLETARRMLERHPEELKLELQRRMNEALEKLRDWRRLWDELKKTGERFGGERLKIGDREIEVREYVTRKLAEVSTRLEAGHATLGEPLRTAGRVAASPWPVLLETEGIVPREPGSWREIVAAGAGVEAWEVTAPKRLWAAPHPGSWSGLGFRLSNESRQWEVASVSPDSPAQSAGVLRGDLVLSIDGRPVADDRAPDRLLAETAPGSAARIRVLREEGEFDLELALTPWPADAGPRPIGSVFTSAYDLAVVWEDVVAAFDVRTGALQWTYRGTHDLFAITAFAATDGRLFLHEHLRPEAQGSSQALPAWLRDRHPAPAEPPPHLRIAESRITCLDDASGRLRWARPVAYDAGAAQIHRIAFLSRYDTRSIGVHVMSARDNTQISELLVLEVSAGKLVRRFPLGSGMMASAWDREEGVFACVNGEKNLLAVRVWPKGRDAGPTQLLQIPLVGRYMDQSSPTCALALGGSWLAFAAPGPQPVPEIATAAQVSLFSLDTGKEHAVVPLPKGRVLPPARPPTLSVGADGTVLVYAFPSLPLQPPEAGSESAAWPAYLCALAPTQGPEKTALAWEAVAPRPFQNTPLQLLQADGWIMLATSAGLAPRENRLRPIVALYGRAQEGLLKMTIFPPAIPGSKAWDPLVWIRHGRLYVQTPDGLDIYAP